MTNMPPHGQSTRADKVWGIVLIIVMGVIPVAVVVIVVSVRRYPGLHTRVLGMFSGAARDDKAGSVDAESVMMMTTSTLSDSDSDHE